MPISLGNPFRGQGLGLDAPMPIDQADSVAGLLQHCPAHAETPLTDMPQLAAHAGVARLLIKDERARMGLGSFKALGAAHAIAREASAARQGDDWTHALRGRVYVTASAGNHGLSVAAGARLFGAEAVIYLAQTVPEAFAERLRAKGARVVRAGATYEASMEAAEAAARDNGWTLLSDSSWPGYIDLPLRVMEGYLQLAAEAAAQWGQKCDAPPSHILLQAGVGGLAAAVAAQARAHWGDAPQIIVVEPAAAPALFESIRAGHLVTAEGPVSAMGRLDCKTPSMIALNGLARDADLFVTITESEAARAVALLAEHGMATTPSGAAGVAAVVTGLGLGPDARVLAYVSEGPERG
ncbi:pyridoxal-phosphate dependent enzyme [Pseudotabrizicola sp. L79]|uniref:pyridoxal-phosphate dependent enzyme n=1 Tax=Pseudotabrizicola sp. L79 TaxID=3118402 RepID=UPI002F91E538